MSRALVGVLVTGPEAVIRMPAPSATAAITNAEAMPITIGPLGAGGRAACAARTAGRPVTWCACGWGCTRSVCRSGMSSRGEMAQQHGQPCTGPGAPALDRSFGDPEQGRCVGHRVAIHIDCDDCGALPCRQSRQCMTNHDLGFGMGDSIGHRTAVVGEHCGMKNIAAQTVRAGVDNDAVQPTADRSVMPKRAGGPVSGEHGLLQGVIGVLGGLAAPSGQPIKLGPVAAKQLSEGVTITGDMCGEQVGIATTVDGEAGHGRTVASTGPPGTSPCAASGGGANGDVRDVGSALACCLAQCRNPHQQIRGGRRVGH